MALKIEDCLKKTATLNARLPKAIERHLVAETKRRMETDTDPDPVIALGIVTELRDFVERDRAVLVEAMRAKSFPTGGQPGSDSANVKSLADTGGENFKDFGDFSDRNPIFKQDFSSLDIERKRMVMAAVLSALKESEIFNSVIADIPVDVMDMLIGQKFSPNGFRHNYPMLKERLSAAMDSDIASRVINIMLRSPALRGAKSPPVSILTESELDPAKMTALRREEFGSGHTNGGIEEQEKRNQKQSPALTPALQRLAALRSRLPGGEVRSQSLEDPAFYSQLGKTIGEKMPARATAAQIRGIVTNTQNRVKAEELKWTGLLPWVEAQPQPVSRDAVMEYLRGEGAVKFEEVTLSSPANPMLRSPIDYSPATKYSQYQLPGGDNYREVIVTMGGDKVSFDQWLADEGLGHRFHSNGTDGQKEIRAQYDAEAGADNKYTSSHFPDVPNYVAHMRVNERTDTEGRPGLFLEELQSDRHQQGREKGYIDPIDAPKIQSQIRELVRRRDALEDELYDLSGAEFIKAAQAKQEEIKSITGQIGELQSSLTNEGKIPDAPFRTAWPLQLFKRALRDAVAAGKQWIGWTTGDTQAERYDLSKQVQYISWHRNPDGTRHIEIPVRSTDELFAFNVGDDGIVQKGQMIQRGSEYIGKPLSEVIGKDATERIMSAPSGKLSGDDLRVGGSGMKAFYDKILPSEIGKYVKQWGAGISQVQLGGIPRNIGPTPFGVAVEDGEIWAVKYDPDPNKPDAFLQQFDTEEEARAWVDDHNGILGTAPIWRVEITPAMATGVRKGQAVFSQNFPDVYSRDIPRSEVAELRDIAEALHFDDGIDTPEKLAAAMNTLGFRDLTENVWNGIRAIKATLPASPDWQGIYAALDKPADVAKSAAENPQQAAADSIKAVLKEKRAFDWRELFSMTDKAWGGTMADGTYTVKDAYDAMELAVNQYIEQSRMLPANSISGTGGFAGLARARVSVNELVALQNLLPTQTKRTAETEQLQQFSTPPALSFVANWVAAPSAADVMIEPSAGIGGLGVFSKMAGAKVIANEFSPRRRAFLSAMGFDKVYGENAEQLNAIFSSKVASGEIKRPTVVVMNPPFSNGAESGKKRDTMIGANHVEEALKLLAPGGRLVAIVGEGMDPDSPTFRQWFQRIGRTYNIRASVWMNGKNYAKYGTTFDNRLLIFDKTGTTTGAYLKASVDNLSELLNLLTGIRDDRPSPTSAEQSSDANAPTPSGEQTPVRAPDTESGGSGAGTGGNVTSSKPAVGTTRDNGPGATANNGQTGVTDTGRTARGKKESAASERPDTGSTAPESSGVTIQTVEAKAATSDDASEVFSTYRPSKVQIPGAQIHPAALVESAAMASVEAPDPAYTPNLPAEVVTSGKLSDVQLENIVYAGQAHEQLLPDGSRRGYFIGDGTGVGKGRQIAGIIMDNWRQGRKKAVWISKSPELINDARRDAEDLGIDPSMISKLPAQGNDIEKQEGIMFASYATLKGRHPEGGIRNMEQWNTALAGKAKPESRVEQLVRWLGKDFDGVIAFDEAHQAGNAVATRGVRGMKKPSQQGIAVVDLQQALPKARIVYVSATGATEVSNLSYADRLGLWGPSTPFPTKLAFFDKVAAGGISAMEIVARDMKAMGLYLARSISFRGVEFERATQELTGPQTQVYNSLARGWQVVLQNINEALAITNAGRSGQATSAAKSAFWGAQQRFFNQVLTAMEVPILISTMEARLAAGDSAVLQLVNTNEAQQERAISQAVTEAAGGEANLEDLDLTPKDILLGMIERSFPTRLYVEMQDPNNPERTVWVPAQDQEGNPINDPEAVARKEAMLTQMALLQVPDGAIEQILDHFGSENVAEITGRSRRLVYGKDDNGNRKRKIEPRSPAKRKVEAKEFQDGKRKILIFSDAGGTGFSYHADKRAKNQTKRAHFLVQAGWKADAAIQGFGRTHRSNQKQPPFYYLVETNIKGHRRFLSTIARRLAQLGALTSGERKASGQGMFKESDNLESEYAEDALFRLVNDIYRDKVPGWKIDDLARKMGFGKDVMDANTGEMRFQNDLLDRETGALNPEKIPGIPQFLNRLLALELNDQNDLFDAFDDRLQRRIETAMSDGTYDPGTQQYRAKRIEVTADEVVYQHPGSTARTRIVDTDVVRDTDFTEFGDLPKEGVNFVRNKKSGRIYAITAGRDVTEKQTGAVLKGVRRIPTHGDAETVAENTIRLTELRVPAQGGQGVYEANYEAVPENEARAAWEKEINDTPKESRKKETFVVGALLPIWDRIGESRPKIYRFTDSNGKGYLGVLVKQQDVPALRARLGAGKAISPEQAFTLAYEDGKRLELANGWTVTRVSLSGQQRLEVIGLEYSDIQQFRDHIGGIQETIAYRPRFFLPVGEKGVPAMKRLMERSPVVKIGSDMIGTQDPEAWERSHIDFNDELDEIEAAMKAGKPTGNPELAYSMAGDQVRVMDEWLKNAPQTKETHAQWEEEATWLENAMGGKAAAWDALLGKMQRGDMLTARETKLADRYLVANERNLGTVENKDRARAFAEAYRRSRSEVARALGSGVDQFMKPAERWRRFLFNTAITPDEGARKAATEARKSGEDGTPAQKEAARRRANKIEDDASRKALERVEAALAKNGFTLDEFLNTDVKIQPSAPVFMRLTREMTEWKRGVMAKLQGGDVPFKSIAKQLGRTEKEVRAVRQEFEDKFRAFALANMKPGMTADDLLKLAGAAGVVRSQSVGDQDAAMEAVIREAMMKMGLVPEDKQGKARVRERRSGTREQISPDEAARRIMARWQDRIKRNASAVGEASKKFAQAKDMTDDARDAFQSKLEALGVSRANAAAMATEAQERLKAARMGTKEKFITYLDLEDAEAVVAAARDMQAGRGDVIDMAMEYLYFSMLSGPKTQVVNLASYPLTIVGDMGVTRGIAAFLNTAFGWFGAGNSMAPQLGEFGAMLKAALPGIADGFRLAAKSWRTGVDFLAYDKLHDKAHGDTEDVQKMIKSMSIEIPRAAIPRALGGDVFRSVFKGMQFVDVLGKTTIAHMEVAAWALRIARKEIKGQTFATKQARMEALESRVAELVGTPGSEAWKQAIAAATEAGFQTPLEGGPVPNNSMDRVERTIAGMLARIDKALTSPGLPGVGGFIGKAVRSIVKLLVLAFVRTPFNITRIGLRKTPLGSIPFLARFIEAGGAHLFGDRTFSEVFPKFFPNLAEQVIAFLGAALIWGAVEGDDDDDEKWFLITGGPLPGRGDREENMTREAATGGNFIIRIGGKDGLKIPFGRYEPIATVLGTTTDMIRSAKMDHATAGERMHRLASGLMGQVEEKTFLRGVADMIQVIDDVRHGNGDATQRWGMRVASMVVPNIIKAPIRDSDPFIRDYRTADPMYQFLPLPKYAQPKISPITGNPIEKEGNGWLRTFVPTATKTENLPDYAKAVLNYNSGRPSGEFDKGGSWAPGTPDTKLRGHPALPRGSSIALKPDVYTYLSGGIAKETARRLAGRISPEMARNPDMETIKLIKTEHEKAGDTVRDFLRRTPPEKLGTVALPVGK